MRLEAFHRVFVACALLLTVLLAAWLVAASPKGLSDYLMLTFVVASAAALAGYQWRRYFGKVRTS